MSEANVNAQQAPQTGQASARVTDPGLEAAFSGPALFANKMYLTVSPVMGRLSFVELPADGGGNPQFRSAIVMNIDDLLALRDLLTRMLANTRTFTAEGPADAAR